MKKRIFTVFIALVCLFSLASCKKDTPYSLYTDAMKQMDSVGGMDAKVKADIKTKIGSTENSTKTEMTVKTNKTAAYIEMEEGKFTYVDGTLYMDLGQGMKTKSTVSQKEFDEQFGSFGASEFPQLTEEDFKDVELKKDGDNKSFTVTLKGDTIKDFVKKALGSMLDGAGNNVTVGDMELTCVFNKDSVLTQMTLVMSITYTEKTVGELNVTATMTYDFNSIDKAPEIAAPADASSYKDAGNFS